MTNICVFGAGAVGGHLAAKLASRSAHRVSVVARGAHLEAIRSTGLRLSTSDGDITAHPYRAVEFAGELDPQDLVVVTLKAPSVPLMAQDISGLLAPEGVALFILNGIPWWWDRECDGSPLLDPTGELTVLLSSERVLGGVAYSANRIVEPGTILHSGANDWRVGAINGRSASVAEAAVSALSGIGIHITVSADIRRDIWLKLLANAPANSLCALTRLPPAEIMADEGLASIASALRYEIASIGRALGFHIEEHYTQAPKVPPDSRTVPSSLQDVLAGRTMEVEAILGEPARIGARLGVNTPVLDVILPLFRALNRTMRCTVARAANC